MHRKFSRVKCLFVPAGAGEGPGELSKGVHPGGIQLDHPSVSLHRLAVHAKVHPGGTHVEPCVHVTGIQPEDLREVFRRRRRITPAVGLPRHAEEIPGGVFPFTAAAGEQKQQRKEYIQ